MNKAWVILVLASLLGLTILGLSSTSQARVKAATTTATQTRAASKFIWTGVSAGQFNDSEISAIATNYDLVVLAKFHAGGDRTLHDADTKRLQQANPNLKVLAYLGASFRFKTDTFGKDTFNTSWYLVDRNTGLPITDPDGNFYVDLANPLYRQWAGNLLAGWMNQAPYAGVAFDNANIFLYEEPWLTKLGKPKIDAWNQGLKSLLTETKTRLGGKLVIFNGLDEAKNVPLLDYSDGGMNERFCVNRRNTLFFSGDTIDKNLSVMKTYAGKNKLVFLKSNYFPKNASVEPPTQAEKENIGRYCLGNFLLAADPKLDFFKSGPGYHAELGEITENAREINLPLGFPSAASYIESQIYKRKFSSGWVFVNRTSSSKTVALPQALVLANGGAKSRAYARGETYTIPPTDAAYFLRP